MMERNKTYKDVRLNERDAMVGRFLSKAINKEKAEDACPYTETIAAFIDGRLDQEEREKMMRHLSACDKCYELFSETIRVIEDVSNSSKAEVKRPFGRRVYYAFAAAAVLLILLAITLQQIRFSSPTVTEKIILISEDGDREFLVTLLRDHFKRSYGFSGELPLTRKYFTIGLYLTDLEVSLMTEDRKRSLELLNTLTSLHKSIKGSEEVILFYKEMIQEIEDGVSLRQLTGVSEEIVFDDKKALLYIRFGQWVEGGRLAAALEKGEYFDIDDARFFIQVLQSEGSPIGVIESLHEIEEILKKRAFSKKEFRRLERLFNSLAELV